MVQNYCDPYFYNFEPKSPIIDYTTYRYKHSLLYRDRAGYTPKLREFMENIATALYSNTFSDRTLLIVSNNNGILKIALNL